MGSYTPSYEEAKALGQRGNLVPIYEEVRADLETPVSAFLKVARGPYSFLLESVEGGERWGRYSFIGTEPYDVLRLYGEEDPLKVVAKQLQGLTPVALPDLPRFTGGAVGYLAWETVRHNERLPLPAPDPLGLPEATFLLTDTMVVFDHLKHKIKVICYARADGDNGITHRSYQRAIERIEAILERLSGPIPQRGPVEQRQMGLIGVTPPRSPEVSSNMSREEYYRMVERCKEYIFAGDIIQVVASQRLARPTAAAPFDIYRALRAINPSPYMFYLHLQDFYLIGASPELLVRVEQGEIDYHPIAGTRPRGKTSEEDLALEKELREDEKERAEHIMLLDLGRNDVGRVSLPGSVKATQVMDVERYSHVMHLVSHVQGRLRPDLTPLDALRACFPAGTVAGAPKIRAMEIIAELEPHQRGPYAGAVGYIDFSGNIDTCITIRTMAMKDGVAYVQAGGGIVADSQPEMEYQETLNKARALMRAIEEAERETLGEIRETGALEPRAVEPSAGY